MKKIFTFVFCLLAPFTLLADKKTNHLKNIRISGFKCFYDNYSVAEWSKKDTVNVRSIKVIDKDKDWFEIKDTVKKSKKEGLALKTDSFNQWSLLNFYIPASESEINFIGIDNKDSTVEVITVFAIFTDKKRFPFMRSFHRTMEFGDRVTYQQYGFCEITK